MKIGLFTDTFVPEVNGVASSTMMLRDELRRRGHRVFVFTTSTPDATMEPGTFRLPSMPLAVLPSRRVGLFYHPRLAEMIRTTGLDVVHTQTEFSLGIFGRVMANAIGAPQVHTYHTIYEDYTHYITRGLFDGQSKKVARTFSRMYCNSCERVLTPSEKTRLLLRQYGVTRPIDIVPTGVDTKKFERDQYSEVELDALRRELGIEPGDKVVLNIGRIAKEKNLDAVFNGLPQLFARHREAKMLLVGGGPYADNLRRIAKELGITDRVIFAGERPWEKIGMYYAMGDVFISASTSETQGLVYIEAMSASLPVVAKEDPVIQGLIDHEKTGLLFTQTDQIADVLERALYDEPLRRTIATGAKEAVRQSSVTTFGERVERSYQAAIESAKKASA